MKTRLEMIRELTEFELNFLIFNTSRIPEVSDFFADGGYNKYTDEELTISYKLRLGEE